ncbi:hypothetical protein JCM17823_17500 [Halorubrum gandharaense]
MERVEVALDEELAGSLSRYARDEQLHRDAAAERLLSSALSEWRRDRAVERFADDEVTFTRAAEIAELEPPAFADLLRDRGVEVDTDRVLAELDG